MKLALLHPHVHELNNLRAPAVDPRVTRQVAHPPRAALSQTDVQDRHCVQRRRGVRAQLPAEQEDGTLRSAARVAPPKILPSSFVE